jgi:hypothetical protein
MAAGNNMPPEYAALLLVGQGSFKENLLLIKKLWKMLKAGELRLPRTSAEMEKEAADAAAAAAKEGGQGDEGDDNTGDESEDEVGCGVPARLGRCCCCMAATPGHYVMLCLCCTLHCEGLQQVVPRRHSVLETWLGW